MNKQNSQISLVRVIIIGTTFENGNASLENVTFVKSQ